MARLRTKAGLGPLSKRYMVCPRPAAKEGGLCGKAVGKGAGRVCESGGVLFQGITSVG